MSRIWTGVFFPVPFKSIPRSSIVISQEKTCDSYTNSANSCWNKICKIIKNSSKFSKIFVLFIFIANHRIQRINCLIAHCKWQPSQKHKKHGSNYSICHIFRNSFHCTSNYRNFIHILSIS